ncbi:hypothetical protein RI367_004173 [Sorochytrium milnesiophthora]
MTTADIAAAPATSQQLPRPLHSLQDANIKERPRRVKSEILVPPTALASSAEQQQLEISICRAGSRFERELVGSNVFPELEAVRKASDCPLLVVLFMQRMQHDTVAFGKEVDDERDQKLERFIRLARSLAQRIQDHHPQPSREVEDACSRWVNFTDPASGRPVRSHRCSKHIPAASTAAVDGPGGVYPDVAGAQQLLQYDTMNVGCCQILLHPRWGSYVYPATLFTNAPLATVQHALAQTV